MQHPNNYLEQVKASVDKAPALTPEKRARLRALLHPQQQVQELGKAA